MELSAVFKHRIREAVLLVPCHRNPDRCYHIHGKPMPICSRCLNILLGYLFIPLFFFVDVPTWLGVLLQLPMLADGLTQLKGWRMSNNILRTITGLMSGIGLSIIIVAIVQFLLMFV